MRWTCLRKFEIAGITCRMCCCRRNSNVCRQLVHRRWLSIRIWNSATAQTKTTSMESPAAALTHSTATQNNTASGRLSAVNHYLTAWLSVLMSPSQRVTWVTSSCSRHASVSVVSTRTRSTTTDTIMIRIMRSVMVSQYRTWLRLFGLTWDSLVKKHALVKVITNVRRICFSR